MTERVSQMTVSCQQVSYVNDGGRLHTASTYTQQHLLYFIIKTVITMCHGAVAAPGDQGQGIQIISKSLRS